jgi:hypothetical protein
MRWIEAAAWLSMGLLGGASATLAIVRSQRRVHLRTLAEIHLAIEAARLELGALAQDLVDRG